MKSNRVAFIIPAFNEEKAIGDVIARLTKAAKNEKLNFAIVVVDDGSSDNTALVAQSKGATVIRHILNSGSGSATLTGLHYAKLNDFDTAATLDADGQHASDDVVKGVGLITEKNVDLLIGSRLINNAGMSKVKVLGNKGLSFITYSIFGIRVTDSQSGLRVFSKEALNRLTWKTSGFEFCSEMLWRAKQLGLTVSEYPIKAIYSEYSSAKGQNNWNGVNIVKTLIERRIMEIFSE